MLDTIRIPRLPQGHRGRKGGMEGKREGGGRREREMSIIPILCTHKEKNLGMVNSQQC